MPKIGLLSDSHGQVVATRAAIRTLMDAGADLILHMGDIGSEQVLDELIYDLPVHVVFGNTDWDWEPLGKYAGHLGLIVNHPVGRLEIDGRVVVFQHGHDHAAMSAALAQQVAYLCHGHTHMKRDEQIGMTRIINPGALQRAREYTVAMLDTQQDQVTFYPIDQG